MSSDGVSLYDIYICGHSLIMSITALQPFRANQEGYMQAVEVSKRPPMAELVLVQEGLNLISLAIYLAILDQAGIQDGRSTVLIL